MTADRRWTPRGCCWKNASPPSVPVWTGRRKKGGAAPTEAVAGVAPARPGENGGVVPRGAHRLRVGAAGDAVAGQPEGSARRADPEALAGAAGPDARGGGTCPGTGAAGFGGGFASFREGEQELRARSVPLLRCGRSAADQQRPGASVRQLSLPRAAGQRSEGSLAGSGGARQRTAGGVGGDAAAGSQRGGVGSPGPAGVATVASTTGAAAGVPPPPTPLPPRSE